jgi:hypothetical protein
MRTWEARDPALERPLAAPLGRCAELLGVDLATVRRAAARVEPYVRVDGTKVWSLMQLERQLRPQAFGRVRGGYIARRRERTHPAGGLAQAKDATGERPGQWLGDRGDSNPRPSGPQPDALTN